MALTLETLRKQRLTTIPRFQKLVGYVLLAPSYHLPRRTEIVLEGAENIPRDRTVFFAMNHTDRYNYWPFQYAMWRRGRFRFTATWVKGKYFGNKWMARFMVWANNIPLPSRGYVIASEFVRVQGRAPTNEEYRELRDLSEREADAPSPPADTPAVPATPVRAPSLPSVTAFLEKRPLVALERYFQEMNAEVIRLNRQAIRELDLNVLVFPQGTRSKRLSKGHVGLAQMAMHLGADIVPVGCSGSDRVYPGGSPWASGGRIVYRVGAPLAIDGPELGPHRVREPFVPLSREASRFQPAFQAATDVVMAKIDGLVDPEYRFAGGESDGVKDVSRFL